MLYPRELSSEILKAAEQYPVVTLLGPRQSGKTTLVRELFPELPYFNLEHMETRHRAMGDPASFLAACKEGAIIDEIQRVPDLLSDIQVMVDEYRQNGQFILTGSHQLKLNESITQSLAGRTDVLTLLPLSLFEIDADLTVDEQIFKGFYPRLYQQPLEVTRYYRNYFATYVERDVKQLAFIKDQIKFEKFVKLCAGRVGQLFNANDLAGSVGISVNTVNDWLSILEASYICFRLKPYYENLGKRLVKSPKLYFHDVGLASYLLGITESSQVARDPLRGQLFENMVVSDCVKTLLNQAKEPDVYFYRDAKGNEVDLLLKHGRFFLANEIKSSGTFREEFLSGIKQFESTVGENRIEKKSLIYSGEGGYPYQSVDILNYRAVKGFLVS